MEHIQHLKALPVPLHLQDSLLKWTHAVCTASKSFELHQVSNREQDLDQEGKILRRLLGSEKEYSRQAIQA